MDKGLQSLEQKRDILEMKVKEVEKEKAKLTYLAEGAQVYAAKEATLLANIRRTFKDLHQAKKDHHAFVEKSYSKISKLCKEVRMTRAEEYFAAKELEKAMNDLDMLRKQVESSETKCRRRDNKILDIISSFSFPTFVMEPFELVCIESFVSLFYLLLVFLFIQSRAFHFDRYSKHFNE